MASAERDTGTYYPVETQQGIASEQFWVKAGLTALSLGPPAVRDGEELQAAGSDVVLQELALEAVHVGISGQGVCAGGDVGLWVDAAGGEGRLLQQVTAAPHEETDTRCNKWIDTMQRTV